MSLILSGKDKREGVYLPSYFPLPGSPWSKFAPLGINSHISKLHQVTSPTIRGARPHNLVCGVSSKCANKRRAKNSRWVLVGVGVCLQLRGEELRGLPRPLVSLSQRVCRKGEQMGDGCWVAEGPRSGQLFKKMHGLCVGNNNSREKKKHLHHS